MEEPSILLMHFACLSKQYLLSSITGFCVCTQVISAVSRKTLLYLLSPHITGFCVYVCVHRAENQERIKDGIVKRKGKG